MEFIQICEHQVIEHLKNIMKWLKKNKLVSNYKQIILIYDVKEETLSIIANNNIIDIDK